MKPKKCDNCVYAVRVAGRSSSALICINKAGSAGRLFFAEPTGLCRNFQTRKKGPLRRKPPSPQSDEIKFIPLTKGKFAIVDAEDYEWLSKHKWHAVKCGNRFYAYRSRNKRSLSMHRVIMKAPKGMVVDHIDGNGLNNRRSNLRLCTVLQNIRNQRARMGTSKYKGVHRDRQHNKWAAAITSKGRYKHIGFFDNEIDAAKAYDKMAAELFGEFAYLNFREDVKKQPLF